ncbi:MAG: FtsB family cell division protein [Chthoniobacterales bacterium]
MRTSAKPDFRKRRETDFWRAANRLLLGLIVIGAVVAAVITFYPEFRRIEEMKASIGRLDVELSEEQLKLRQQEREENWLKNDPEYVEMQARELLGVMKEGETIFRLDLEKNAAPPVTADPPAPPAK